MLVGLDYIYLKQRLKDILFYSVELLLLSVYLPPTR